MPSSKDFSEMSTEQLLAELGKINSSKITSAVFIGALIGIAFYAAAHKSFILPVLLMIFVYWMVKSHSKNLKNLQEEISRRESAESKV